MLLLVPVVAAGAATVELTAGNLHAGTKGFGVLWLLIGAAVVVSLPVLRRVQLTDQSA